MAQRFATQRRVAPGLRQTKVFSFLLTRSLLGTIRSAMNTGLEMMKSQEFEDQLVVLMTAYIDQA